jgi:hypothetical protein
MHDAKKCVIQVKATHHRGRREKRDAARLQDWMLWNLIWLSHGQFDRIHWSQAKSHRFRNDFCFGRISHIGR